MEKDKKNDSDNDDDKNNDFDFCDNGIVSTIAQVRNSRSVFGN